MEMTAFMAQEFHFLWRSEMLAGAFMATLQLTNN